MRMNQAGGTLADLDVSRFWDARGLVLLPPRSESMDPARVWTISI